ncbi:MAG: Rqc2 family fibronectin-binding protein [Christensenellales bacterium]
MTVDGVMLHAITAELQKYTGARIDKIYQPAADEIQFSLRCANQTVRLLLSSNPSNCRIHLTKHAKPNPDQAPMFCMLLRKHLTGARIVAIRQPSLDRIVEIALESNDELFGPASFRLVLEIMSRHSNIILVSSDNVILDSIKHVSSAMSSVRIVLPGQPYVNAPSQGKTDPLTVTHDELVQLFAQKGAGPLDKYLSSQFTGISIACAREIILRCFGQENRYDALDDAQSKQLAESVFRFFRDIRENRFHPALLKDGQTVFGFAPLTYISYSSFKHEYMDANDALDEYYHIKETKERYTQKSQALAKSVQARLAKTEKKLVLQMEALQNGSKMETAKLYGELLTANIHTVKRGSRQATVTNYYDGQQIAIPLDPSLSPSANAQRFYKQYAKMRTAQTLAQEQVVLLQSEAEYLECQLLYITQCNEISDLQQIRSELESQGFLKSAPVRKKAPAVVAAPLHFYSSDGYEIWVGKNNTQNDLLTHQAASEDMWMHAKNMPGSHVIIKDKNGISSKAIWEGALLAAYFSKGKTSQNVPVDYCLRKYVKKPGGSKPGMAVYTTNKTAYITPDEAAVESMKRG